MADVLLVIPPYYYKTKVLTSSVKEYAGVGYLAAVLRQNGYRVEVLDADLAGYTPEQTLSAILQSPAPVIGFTLLQVAATVAIDIVKQLRKNNVASHIVAGGHFPTFAATEILTECPEIDSVVVGEGEDTLLELAKSVFAKQDWRGIAGLAFRDGQGQVVFTEPRPLIRNLDALPFQSRDTLKEVLERGGPAAIITSRGCYGNCAFCSVNAFYKTSPGPKWRPRSPENVADELQWLTERFGARVFVFNDDNFFGPGEKGRSRARQLAEAILRRKLAIEFAAPAAVNDVEKELFAFLKTAGLRSVFLGIESMRQEDLKFLNKHTTVEQNVEAIRVLEELGIFYQIGFILFYPYTTLEQIAVNIRYIKDHIVHNPYCGTQVFTGELRVLHGTPLETRFKDAPFLRKERFNYTYTVQDSRVEELKQLMDQLILKKSFPMMVDCKEEVMSASAKRQARIAICDFQLEMALKVVELLERHGTIGPRHLKQIIRDLNGRLAQLKERIFRMQCAPRLSSQSYDRRSA